MSKRIHFLRIMLLLVVMMTSSRCVFSQTANVYGYSQIDYSASNLTSSQPEFDIARLNILGDLELSPKSRFFTNIEIEDNFFSSEEKTIGSFKFAELWAEYTFKPELKLRVGKTFTDFGLYNKIHDASVTFFSINSPLIYSEFAPNADFTDKQKMFGKYIVGLTVTGTYNLDNTGSQIEYTAMYGYGRHEFVGSEFVGHNAAYAGMVIFRPGFVQGLQVGGSFYTDKNEIGVAGAKNQREIVPAAELQYEAGSLQIQSEAFFPSFKNLSGNDQSAFMGYLHVAYTLWDVCTPYVQTSYMKFDNTKSDHTIQPIFGVCYAVSDKFYAKAEFQYNSMETNGVTNNFTSARTSLSMSF